MNESMDRMLAEWLHEGPESGPRQGLERSLAATRRVGQRPGWTLIERWIPMQLAMTRTRVQRPILAIVFLALLTMAVVAAALFVGAQRHQSPLVRNGVIALVKDGDILVADRPGGDLRPLVAGPENDGSPVFSPDGTRLAFVRASDPEVLMIADADGTNAVQLPMREFESTSGWSFAPDGRSLMAVAVFGGAKHVVIRPIDPVAALTVLDVRLPDSWQEIEYPRFRPTNPQEILVVAQLEPDPAVNGPNGPRGLYVYDLATGGLRTIVEPADDRYVHDVAWLPDGEHIIYSLYGDTYVVAADGSGAEAFDGRRDRISPLSNDGTRIVVDVAEVDLPGDDSHQRSVVVPIYGEGEGVELACGLGTRFECAWSWTWSPDDSMLIGTVPHWTSSDRETSLPDTYLQADPNTGQVTELGWVDVGTPVWQRVVP